MSLILRRFMKVAALSAELLQRGLCWHKTQPGISFLIYHGVSGQLPLELDLPFSLFRRQLAYLANMGQVISYAEALALLHSKQLFTANYYVLTFDDGYLDFYTHVFPLLQEFTLPAMLYVTTGFVEEGVNYPLKAQHLPVSPVSWQMLEEMRASDLITIGAHTHTHPELPKLSPEQLDEELDKSQMLFQQRLGIEPTSFAYPRARWNDVIERQVQRFYHSAVVGEGQKATTTHFHPHRIPRIPIRRSDGWHFFLAKIHGWLQLEEKFYSFLKKS